MYTVDLILKPSKAMCSLFRQVDEQGSDSDIPATCAVTVGDEALSEGSTSRRQSLFVPQEDSEESDEGSSLDNESQVQLNRFLHLRVYQCSGIQRTSVLNADTYRKLNNVFLQCWMSWYLKIRKICGRSFVIVTLYVARVRLWSKAGDGAS